MARRPLVAAVLDAPRLRADAVRYWASVSLSLASVAAGVAVAVLLGAPVTITVSSGVIAYFCAWIVFCAAYAALTWRVLSRADGTTLAAWLREGDAQRRDRQRTEVMYGSGGPAGAVGLSAIALGAVVLVAVLDGLQDSPWVIGLAVAVVASSWGLLVVVYAVHYARENTRDGGLGFPDTEPDRPPELVDHVYLAVQVATTCSASDVVVRTSGMRREVTTHSVIAFTFNTVVIALLVSLVLTLAG